MTAQKPFNTNHQLYTRVCLPVRFLLAFLLTILVLEARLEKEVAYFLYAGSAGWLFQAILKRKRSIFGFEIWWNIPRILHLVTWLTAATLLMIGFEWGILFMFDDVIIGLVYVFMMQSQTRTGE